MDYEPPFLETCKSLLQKQNNNNSNESSIVISTEEVVEYCDLPSIDLEGMSCEEIWRAAKEWGFFEVVNHGVAEEVLESIRCEQVKLFQQPFVSKLIKSDHKIYRWGNPSATTLKQMIWSEAFHFPLSHLSTIHPHKSLKSSIEAFAAAVLPIAERLAEILASKLNRKKSSWKYLRENCSAESCIIRLNRYPPCPIPSEVYGLLPHSDTSFVTIIYQVEDPFVAGLQLLKDGHWVAVNPNPRALVVNIGDLFQAFSNGLYKSVKHRVVVAEKVERFSIAFFYCPTEEAVIQSHDHDDDDNHSNLYRKFTLKEYRDQNHKDVMQTGDKAVSNGVYKSVKHRVVASEKRQRFSVAYPLMQSYTAMLHRRCTGISPIQSTKIRFRKIYLKEFHLVIKWASLGSSSRIKFVKCA